MSENYGLFAGSRYYPEGGAWDFRGFGDLGTLKSYYAKNISRWADCSPWGQIVDMATMKCLYSIYGDNDNEWVDGDFRDGWK